MSEPSITSEEGFQKAVLEEVRHRLAACDVRCVALLESFGLDAALLLRSPSCTTELRLIEFKVFNAQRPGGIGFGNGSGRGPQVDLLLIPEADLALFDGRARWCFADLTTPPDPATACFRPWRPSARSWVVSGRASRTTFGSRTSSPNGSCGTNSLTASRNSSRVKCRAGLSKDPRENKLDSRRLHST